MHEWLTSPERRASSTRLMAFRATRPDVPVHQGNGYWQSEHTDNEGRQVFWTELELDALLDRLERELP
jgi:hypothetical protein